MGYIQWECATRIAIWENRIPFSLYLALALRGATSGFGIGRERLNATIIYEFKASPDVVTGILKLFSHDV